MGRKSDWGLDTPRGHWTERQACTLEQAPHADVVRAPASQGNIYLTPGNERLLATCRSCPVRQECFDDWAAKPISTRAYQIAGGHIWTGQGKPVRQGDQRVVYADAAAIPRGGRAA